MTDIAPKWFNSVDLGAYGLVTSAISGIHDSAGVELARTWVARRSVPNDVIVRRSLVPIKLKCVVAEETHDLLVAKLHTLRPIMSPTLKFCEFSVDRPSQRTFARAKGFGIIIDQIPYIQREVEWDWELERYPWWEDAGELAVTITGATGTVNNTGHMEAYPVYTCTVGATLSTGLSFAVGGVTFSYTGALSAGQVLTVKTDLPDVLLDGSRDWGHTYALAEFPPLAVGANTITKSSANFTLGLTWRRRYE